MALDMKIADFFGQLGFEVNEADIKKVRSSIKSIKTQLMSIKDTQINLTINPASVANVTRTANAASEALRNQLSRVTADAGAEGARAGESLSRNMQQSVAGAARRTMDPLRNSMERVFAEVSPEASIRSAARNARRIIQDVPGTLDSTSEARITRTRDRLSALQTQIRAGMGRVDIGFDESDLPLIREITTATEILQTRIRELGNAPARVNTGQFDRSLLRVNEAIRQAQDFPDQVLARSQISGNLERLRSIRANVPADRTGDVDLMRQLDVAEDRLRGQLRRRIEIDLDIQTRRGMQSISREIGNASAQSVQASNDLVERLITNPQRERARQQALLTQRQDLPTGERAALSEGINRNFQTGERELRAGLLRMDQDIQRIRTATQQLHAERRRLEQESGEVARRQLQSVLEQIRVNGRAEEQVARNTQRVREQMFVATEARINQAQRSTFQQFRSRIGEMRSLVQSLIVPLAAGFGLARIANTGREMESIAFALTAATGSAEQAAKDMKFLRVESFRLGLSFKDTAEQYKNLTAATNSAGMSTEDTREIFLGIVEASTALQLSQEDVKGTLRAMTQIMQKGKVSAEELRQQMGERLPIAINVAAKAMGVTTGELDKLLSTGKLTAKEFGPKFAQGLREFAKPALPLAVKSFSAELGLAKTAITDFFLGIGKAGLMDVFTSAIQGFRVALLGLEVVLKPIITTFNFLTLPIQAVIKLMSELNRSTEEGTENMEGFAHASKILVATMVAGFLFVARGAITTLTIAIGSKLLPMAARLAPALLAGTTAVTTLSGALVVLRTVALGALAVLGKLTFVAGIAIIISDFMEELAGTNRRTIFDIMEEKFPIIGGAIKFLQEALGAVFKITGRVLALFFAIFKDSLKIKDIWEEVSNIARDVTSEFDLSSKTIELMDSGFNGIKRTMLQMQKIWGALTSAFGGEEIFMDAQKQLFAMDKLQAVMDKDKKDKKEADPDFAKDVTLDEAGRGALSKKISSIFSTGIVTRDDLSKLRNVFGVSFKEFSTIVNKFNANVDQKGESGFFMNTILRQLSFKEEELAAITSNLSALAKDGKKFNVNLNPATRLPASTSSPKESVKSVDVTNQNQLGVTINIEGSVSPEEAKKIGGNVAIEIQDKLATLTIGALADAGGITT